jgi:hypothetical protein
MLLDPARLAALRAAAVLDTAPDAGFDALATLAREALAADTAYVTLVDADRAFLKSCVRADGAAAVAASVAAELSFCAGVVERAAAVAVADARTDPAWRDHPGTLAFDVVAYLGVPIETADGHVLGTLCVTHGEPRVWSAGEGAVLRGVAAAVARELEMRGAIRRLAEREAAFAATVRERDAVFAAIHDLMLVIDADGAYLRVLPTAPSCSTARPSSSSGAGCTTCSRWSRPTRSWPPCGRRSPSGGRCRTTTRSTCRPSTAIRRAAPTSTRWRRRSTSRRARCCGSRAT